MPRFTLHTALLPLTSFCVGAATLYLAVAQHGVDNPFRYFVVSCISAALGFGVLIHRIGFSLVLGLLIPLMFVYGSILLGLRR